MSRLQFTAGAGHRRGRARQKRPMRSRRPPCRRQGIEVRRNVHFFGPALRAPSYRMALRCVLGRSMLARERAVHFLPDDPVALTFNCEPCVFRTV